jgi:histone chaperone ASF1
MTNNDINTYYYYYVGNYLDQEFVRIGYFVNNDYSDPFEPENYPNPVDINLLFRSILANEPRVTRYAIDWTGHAPVGAPLEAIQDGEVPSVNPDDEEEEMGEEDDYVETDEDEEEEEEEEGDVDIDLEADASMDGDIADDGEDDGEGEDGEEEEEEDVEEGGEQIQYMDEDSMDVGQMQVDMIGSNSHSFPTPFL